MEKFYKVYGDYALVSECLLESFDTLTEADRWLNKYSRYGYEMGGYHHLESGWHSEDGEWHVSTRFEEEEEY